MTVGRVIARPRRASAMFRRLVYVIGAVVGAIGVAMLPAFVVALVAGDADEAMGIAIASLLTTSIGWGSWRYIGRRGVLSTKEGFATVGLAWFVLSVFGALPYLLSGGIPSITHAFFETASGFSTTGSTILTDPGLLGPGLLFWRAETQWLGGMGVIVLSIAILPLLGVGGVELARAESPGPTPDRLTPRFQETARRLWLVYLTITAIEVLLLWLGEMTLFEAVIHSFTTMSTGGFGTEADSLSSFSAYTQWIVIVFMFIAGASFTLHYRALRDPKVYGRSREFGLYGLITLAAIVIVAGGRFPQGMGIEETVRESAFNTIAIITTTGFATSDFAMWRPALQIFMVGLMFIGGMAGSTAGGVKVFRVGLLGKAAGNDLRRVVHPKGVFVTRFGDQIVPQHVVDGVQSFFSFYMFAFMTGTFLLAFIDANMGEDLGLITAASAVAACLGNIGPGLGDVGPALHYLAIPDVGLWLLSFMMILGRLELFPVLLLFTRRLWTR